MFTMPIFKAARYSFLELFIFFAEAVREIKCNLVRIISHASQVSNLVVGGMPDTKVSLYAVFDGHGGDEASELASQNLHKRFLHHLYKRVQPSLLPSHSSQAPGLPSAGKKKNLAHQGKRIVESHASMNSSTSNANRSNASGEIFVQSDLGVVLKEALAEAISDIESSFSIVSCKYSFP